MNSLTTRGGTLLAPQLDYILLDGSDSMRSQWWESLGAIDNYVKTLATANLNAQIMLVTFDSQNIDLIHRDCALKDWKPLNEEPIGANFTSTPLYDAINAMCRRLRDLNPPKAHIIIVTDGDENASSITTQDQAKALLAWARAKGWQITFLGANFDNTMQAKLLGGPAQSTIGVRKEKLGEAATNLGTKSIRYGQYGEDIHFTDADRTKFGGYLTSN